MVIMSSDTGSRGGAFGAGMVGVDIGDFVDLV